MGEESVMDIIACGSRPSRKGLASSFTGTVWQDPIIQAPDPALLRAGCPVTVDLAAFFVYLAARNMVFGFTVLTRCRLWAATQVISQKLGLLPPER